MNPKPMRIRINHQEHIDLLIELSRSKSMSPTEYILTLLLKEATKDAQQLPLPR